MPDTNQQASEGSKKGSKKAKTKSNVIVQAMASTRYDVVVEAVPSNEYAVKCSHRLYQKLATLPQPIAQSMIPRTKYPDTMLNPFISDSSDSADGHVVEEALGKPKRFMYGIYSLTWANIQRTNLGEAWAVGEATSEATEDDEGINIPTADLSDRSSSRVQMLIQIDPSCGIPVIRCTDQQARVFILEDGKWNPIGYAEMRVLYQKTTPVRVGKSDFQLVLPSYKKARYAAFLRARNSRFEKAGLRLPHSQLYAFPRDAAPFPRVGPIIVHDKAELPGIGYRWIGVNVYTAESVFLEEVCVVEDIKDARSPDDKLRVAMIKEAQYLLSFVDEEGVLQAKEVRCQHGASVNEVSLQINGPRALEFCSHKRERQYIIYPLPAGTLALLKFSEIPTDTIMQLMHSLWTGLSTIHSRGVVHRGIRPECLLILSTDEPRAVIGGFRKASGLPSLANNNPENIAESSGAILDVDNLALVLCQMLRPEVSDMTGSDWRNQWAGSLDKFTKSQNKPFVKVVSQIQETISASMDKILTSAEILRRFPKRDEVTGLWKLKDDVAPTTSILDDSWAHQSPSNDAGRIHSTLKRSREGYESSSDVASSYQRPSKKRSVSSTHDNSNADAASEVSMHQARAQAGAVRPHPHSGVPASQNLSPQLVRTIYILFLCTLSRVIRRDFIATESYDYVPNVRQMNRFIDQFYQAKRLGKGSAWGYRLVDDNDETVQLSELHKDDEFELEFVDGEGSEEEASEEEESEEEESEEK